MDSGCGSAAVFYLNGIEQFHIRNRHIDRSIQIAEQFAIKQAIEKAIENNYSGVCVITDRLSLVKKLMNTYVPRDIAEIARKCVNRGFDIAWVSAHCGQPGNERADTLAKEAIHEGLEVIYPRPISYYKTLSKIRLTKRIKDVIDQSTLTRPRCCKTKKCNLFNHKWITRESITYVKLKKWKLRSNDLCVCGKKGTIEHIYLRCLNNKGHRRTFMEEFERLDRMFDMKGSYQWELLYGNFESRLTFAAERGYKCGTKFLRSISESIRK